MLLPAQDIADRPSLEKHGPSKFRYAMPHPEPAEGSEPPHPEPVEGPSAQDKASRPGADFVPTPKLRALSFATEMQARALRDIVAPQAARRGERLAAASVVADVEALLVATCRLMAREPHWRARLIQIPNPSWAALSAKLALCTLALAYFRERYITRMWDDDEDEAFDDAQTGVAL